MYFTLVKKNLLICVPIVFVSVTALPLSALRLVVPPLRLMSAFLWQVVQRHNVTQYEKLEQFVLLVSETVPDIMSPNLMNKLIFYLRKKVKTFLFCYLYQYFYYWHAATLRMCLYKRLLINQFQSRFKSVFHLLDIERCFKGIKIFIDHDVKAVVHQC